MSEKENLLIAKFMDVKIEKYPGSKCGTLIYYVPGEPGGTYTLEYDTSWDWLMPVFIKIRNICIDRSLGKLRFLKESIPTDVEGNLYDALLKVDKEKIYNAIVQFIEWYNHES